METNQTSEVTLRIPPSIAVDIGSNEIIKLLLDKAQSTEVIMHPSRKK
jgi:hypothetical protein